NLGVGVYYDDQGRIPILQAVQKAEEAMMSKAAARSYLPIEGINTYNLGAQTLLLGADSPVIAEGRALTVQSLGGTGALKIGADFLKQLLPDSQVFISDPSWENHRALFERAGFKVGTYAYYDAATHGLNFEGMLAALRAMPAQSIVVLHACCHNLTGALKIGADFLKQLLPDSQVFISDPSWENHRALFERAGFKVGTYAYYDAATHGLNFEGMLAALRAMPAQSIVVLHACCHNPT